MLHPLRSERMALPNGLSCATFHAQKLWTNMPGEKKRKNKGTEPIDLLPPEEVIFGCSSAMQQVRRLATRTCATNVPVC